MAKRSGQLSSIFHALSDPTRRAVVRELSKGPATVSDLAEPHDMALPSFVQHLKVLERTGLIRSHKVGRVRTCAIVPDQVESAERWLIQARSYWESRLDSLASHIEADQTKASKGGKHE